MDTLVWIVVLIIFVLGFRLGWQLYRARRAHPSLRGRVVTEPQETPERERRDLRGELPPGHQLLIQGPELAVAGESNYRDAIERVVGRRAEGHKAIVNAALIAEPQNRYDPNAIAVRVDGHTFGYLPRADAIRYKPVMDWAREQGFVPCVRADVKGGWREDDGSWADFGIRLYVASPEKILDPRSGSR
jgi:hypothetical protein